MFIPEVEVTAGDCGELGELWVVVMAVAEEGGLGGTKEDWGGAASGGDVTCFGER